MTWEKRLNIKPVLWSSKEMNKLVAQFIHPRLWTNLYSCVISVDLSICLTIYLSTWLSVCLSMYLSIYLFVYLYFCITISPLICLSVCLSAHPSLRLLVSFFTHYPRIERVACWPHSNYQLKFIPVKLRTKEAHGIDVLDQCSTSWTTISTCSQQQTKHFHIRFDGVSTTAESLLAPYPLAVFAFT